jgi:cell division protease FtsH
MAANRRRRRRKKSRLGLWTFAAVGLVLAAYVGVVANSRPSVQGDRLRFDTFVDHVDRGLIRDAHVLDQDSFVVGHYTAPATPGRPGGVRTYGTPYLKAGDSRAALLQLLVDHRVPTTIDQQYVKGLLGPATLLLPALIFLLLTFYLLMSFRRGTGLFGLQSGARKAGAGDARVTFAEVAGQEAALVELREVRDFLADPDRFAAFGAVVPKGILLFGPPGCGKTLLARAVAGEAGAAFYSISGSDFVELYVGVGASRVRELFQEARDNAPAIVFIDELDAVGRRRGGGHGSGSGEEQEQALNQILTELDGFSPLHGIVVIGATNRPDILDPALLRPGRFDRSIALERPDEAGRLAILAVHGANKPLAGDVDLHAVAARAVGLSGADLAGVMNEGGLLAARSGGSTITQGHLEAALTRILEAPERQRRLSMRDRGFGRSTGGHDRVGFVDVAGVDEALVELAEVRDYLAEPERFAALGARPPRGFLLAGPPGCGKTLLARAVATEANAAFFSVPATEFVEVYVGEGAGRVRDLFSEARTAAPSIVFIDEIDAVGARRGASAEGGREREQTLNQILVELDGFDARTGVIVMAATNRPEILDPALVRPGRFDRTVILDLPDRQGRRAILGVHARTRPLAADVDLDAVASMTQGFSGADLANMLNEAALLSARANLAEVPMHLVEEAAARVSTGVSRAQVVSGAERRVVAYHETGHALVGKALGVHVPRKISIVARGRALGTTWHEEAAERTLLSRSGLIDRMAALLGGRVAEELVFGQPSSGASDDLEQVARVARMMVWELGMSERLGPVSYGDSERGARQYSHEVAGLIDAEIRLLVDEAHQRAHEVLRRSRAAMDRVAEALLDRETVDGAEFEVLAGEPQYQPAERAAAKR